MEDESEPIEEAPEATEPLPAQVAPPPLVHSTPTLPTSPTEPASVGPSCKRCRSPPSASAVPLPDTTAKAVVPEFVILEATTPVALVRCYLSALIDRSRIFTTINDRLPSYRDYLGLLELGLQTLSSERRIQSIDWRSVSVDGFMSGTHLED
ncbi:hypothetical protein Tco_1563422 [Tanacetum coccineum]